MIRTPYLVQRAEIQHPLAEASERFSNSVSLDYMGSAEFEFGALPKSLRALQARVDDIKITVDNRITTGENDNRSLRVLHTFTPEEFEEYFVFLQRMRKDDLRLKERSDFGAVRRDWNKTDLWWDIENHVMFSFDKMYMKRLPDYLVASWKYMDDEKAKRS
jgi:hypothetical protein